MSDNPRIGIIDLADLVSDCFKEPDLSVSEGVLASHF
jgi:hypothetical protein